MAAYDWDPNVIFGQAPRTNVGIVSLGNNQYVAPRDPRAKDLLGYSAYENVEGVPQLGIPDQLMPKIRAGTETMYDRPEELEFGYDPNQPVPGGIYNTELNPFDPSSKFFPYEPDYAGLMSLVQYGKQKGDVLDVPTITKMVEDPQFPHSEPRMAKKIPWDPDLGEKETSFGFYDPRTRKVTFNPYAHEEGDIEEMRDTLLHEGKHYFINQYGDIVPLASALSRSQQHDAIYFADMFRQNPNYYGSKMTLKNRDTALAFMEMQNKAKKLWEDRNQYLGKSKSERLYGTEEQQDLMEAGRGALGQTWAQRKAQERMMGYPQRGDVTAAPYNEEMQKYEAERSGGTVNPHEIMKAVARAYVQPTPTPTPTQPVSGPGQTGGPAGMGSAPHFSQGGLVSINHITRRL